MATIDLIVLGMLKKEELSAYDIQKLVEYRNISKWVKISTPSIYKKVIQLEQKGLISSRTEKEGNMPEKAVYSLTENGEIEFEKLMHEISKKPIHLIEMNIDILLNYLENNQKLKEKAEDVPATGMAVLCQQITLAQAIKTWIADLKKTLF